MKIVFLSNFFNHHQEELCESFWKETDGKFLFIETEEIPRERKKLGWKTEYNNKYIKRLHKIKNLQEQVSNILNDTDAVIYGGIDHELFHKPTKCKPCIFRYSERIYKNGYQLWKWPIRIIRFWLRYGRYKNLYMLCASAYTPLDYAIHHTFLKKTYKWGYFPKTKHYNLEELMQSKNRKKILWCGRLIDWKHPDDVIEIADKLKNEGYDFEIDFIGTGVMEERLQQSIYNKGLQKNVRLQGAMDHTLVRKHMENAGIFLFTSDFQEGWGAVLNEAMNSGCSVVASHAIGSVPYLIKNIENGLIYRNGDINGLYEKVKYLLDYPEEQERIGKSAYKTITNLWNAEIAAERFVNLVEKINENGYCDLYDDGPCSRAEIIKNNWFEE